MSISKWVIFWSLAAALFGLIALDMYENSNVGGEFVFTGFFRTPFLIALAAGVLLFALKGMESDGVSYGSIKLWRKRAEMAKKAGNHEAAEYCLAQAAKLEEKAARIKTVH